MNPVTSLPRRRRPLPTVLVLTAAAALLLGLLAPATPASSATSRASARLAGEVAYTLSQADPVLTGRLGAEGSPCVADATAGSYAYSAVLVRVSVSGDYGFDDLAGPSDPDGLLGVYAGAFDPAETSAGCLAVFDTDANAVSVALDAATTYTLVRSTGTSGQTGSFAFAVEGPGALTEVARTTTTLTASPSPSELSKPVRLTARVTGGTPTGQVQFRDGATVLGAAPVRGGRAVLKTTRLALGRHTLTAAYLGDATTTASTGSVVHRVKPGKKPKVTLKVSATEVAVGSKVTLRWSSRHADKVKAFGSWRGKRAAKGTRTVRISELGRHVFKLRATNVNGKAKAKVVVRAVRAPKQLEVTVPEPIVANDTDLVVRSVGLDPRERFKVFFDDKLLVKGFADRAGAVRTSITVPKSAAEGEHEIAVVGSRPDRRGEVEVQVVRAKLLDVTAATSPVPAKTNQTITVTGLAAGETVTLTMDGKELTEGVADASGTFTHTFGVGRRAGVRTVEAVGQLPSRNGQVTFEVTAPSRS